MRKMESEGPYTKTSTWKPSYVDEMTDDKGAGEEIYKHSTYCHATYEFSKCLGCAFAAGRKAERERCLAIIKPHMDLAYRTLKRICNEIGGQDAK